jgi:hypothetical protein
MPYVGYTNSRDQVDVAGTIRRKEIDSLRACHGDEKGEAGGLRNVLEEDIPTKVHISNVEETVPDAK